MQKNNNKTVTPADVRELDCFIFDIDGTVALATTPIPEAIDFILRLRRAGKHQRRAARVSEVSNGNRSSDGTRPEESERSAFP